MRRIRGVHFMAGLHGLALICLTACSLLLAACAAGPAMVDHAFSFSAGTESPGYEVLAYRYGDGKGVSRSSDNAIRQFGSSNQWTNINGPMPLGDSLYVKWRDKRTDQLFEKTIDLKSRLPKDMTNQRIHFVVGEGEVYVYLKDMGLLGIVWVNSHDDQMATG